MDGTHLDPTCLTFLGSDESQCKLYSELALAKLEFGEVQRDRTGRYGGGEFDYATLAALFAATTKPLARHGITISQHVVSSPTGPTFRRLVTVMHGHGAKTIEALDFDLATGVKPTGYTEAVKEEGKLRTYYRRYAYASMLGLDADPDADEAPDQRPQGPRREAPRPESHAQPQRAAQPKPVPAASIPQQKPDALVQKLTTVAPPSDDVPVDADLERQFMELKSLAEAAGMTKIKYSAQCAQLGVIPIELRNYSKKARAMMDFMRTFVAQPPQQSRAS